MNGYGLIKKVQKVLPSAYECAGSRNAWSKSKGAGRKQKRQEQEISSKASIIVQFCQDASTGSASADPRQLAHLYGICSNSRPLIGHFVHDIHYCVNRVVMYCLLLPRMNAFELQREAAISLPTRQVYVTPCRIDTHSSLCGNN
jgi:hypothetical protein